MQRNQIASFDDLLNKMVALKYSGQSEHHKKLITNLQKFTTLIETDNTYLAKQAYRGLWLYYFHTIDHKYYWTGSNKQNRYYVTRKLFGDGSNLSDELQTALKLKEQPHEATKLIYFNALYLYMQTPSLQTELQAIFGLEALEAMQGELRTLRIKSFAKIRPLVEANVQAIPTEKILNQNITELKTPEIKQGLFSFFSEGEQLDKLSTYYIQLIQALAKIATDNIKGEHDASSLPFAERVTLGILFNVIHKHKNIDLSRACCQALGRDNIDNVEIELQDNCLAALQLFLKNLNYVTQIESYGTQNFTKANHLVYMEKKALDLKKNVKELRCKLTATANGSSDSYIRTMVSILAALVVAPLGYSAGHWVGYLFSNTRYVQKPEKKFDQAFNWTSEHLNQGYAYLGPLAAHSFTEVASERAYGKSLEFIFMLLGFSFASSLVLAIGSLKYLCDTHLLCKEQINTILAQSCDQELVECLFSLDKEVFSEEKKEQLEKNVGYQLTP